MNKSRKLLLVDNCSLTSLGIKHALSGINEIKIIGIVASWQQAEQLVHNIPPNIILISHTILPFSEITILADFHQSYPDIKIILFGDDCNGLCLQRLMKAGVCSLILKQKLTDVISSAIQIVIQGGYYFCPSTINNSSCPTNTTLSPNNIITLTSREQQVFDLAITGLNAVQIASQLDLAPQTIRNNLSSIYCKTGVQSQVELTAWAWQYRYTTNDNK